MFYDKVKTLCNKRGVSIAKLEKDMSIGNGTIAGWKNSTPNVKTLEKVAKYFNVSLADLLKDE